MPCDLDLRDLRWERCELCVPESQEPFRLRTAESFVMPKGASLDVLQAVFVRDPDGKQFLPS